jgi:hypothetical protein
MRLPETLRQPPQWQVLLTAVGLVGVIGWMDHVTDADWRFFAPFAVPIVLVTWQNR